MFKWVSVTFNVQALRRERRHVGGLQSFQIGPLHWSAEYSDRTEPEEDSPVYTTRAAKFRVYRFPWRQGSISFSIQALGGSDCHKREYLPASQRQTHLHATCTAGRTRWGSEAGQRGRGFSDHEFFPATVRIEFARETTRRKNLEVGAQGFG